MNFKVATVYREHVRHYSLTSVICDLIILAESFGRIILVSILLVCYM